MDKVLNFSSGLNVIIRALINKRGGGTSIKVTERLRDATLLSLRIKEEVMNQGMQVAS